MCVYNANLIFVLGYREGNGLFDHQYELICYNSLDWNELLCLTERTFL